MNFYSALNIILGWEGGLSNDKYDRGGKTKFGISQKQYPDLDIENLTKEKAKEIYRKDYWDELKCDKFYYDELKFKLFDFGVNAGPERSAYCLQRALEIMGYNLTVDGVIGPETIGIANSATAKYPKALMAAFRGYIFKHYESIVLNDKSQLRFIKGWLNRI